MAELSNILDPDEQMKDGRCGARIGPAQLLTCPEKAEYKIRMWDESLQTNFDVLACATHALEAREQHDVLKITNLKHGRTEV